MIVEAFVNASQTQLYGWKQGNATWRAAAPPFHGQLTQLFAVPTGGEDELIAVTGGGQGQGVDQNSLVLTGTTYTVQSYLP